MLPMEPLDSQCFLWLQERLEIISNGEGKGVVDCWDPYSVEQNSWERDLIRFWTTSSFTYAFAFAVHCLRCSQLTDRCLPSWRRPVLHIVNLPYLVCVFAFLPSFRTFVACLWPWIAFVLNCLKPSSSSLIPLVLEAAGLYGEESETNPYVVIAAGRGRFKTQVTEMTCNPVWDEAFSMFATLLLRFQLFFWWSSDMKDSKKVLVTVWTKADAGDRFLGLLTLDVAELPLDGSQNWYELQGRRGKDDLVSGEVCLSFLEDVPYVSPL